MTTAFKQKLIGAGMTLALVGIVVAREYVKAGQ